MDELLEKYAGGRIPPLVPPPGKPLDSGLLNGELVKIYQRGFATVHSLPLGILAADQLREAGPQKWDAANYGLNEFSRSAWVTACGVIRHDQEGERECEACDRRFASQAEQANRVVAYLCDHGMIDFAVPVIVSGAVIAVLLAGQRKPRPGTRWNPEFVHGGGLFRELAPGEEGEDAWPVARTRLERTERRLNIPGGSLLNLLEQNTVRHELEVGPDDVQRIMDDLETAGKQLSELATTTFQSHKARIVAWIRSGIAESLKNLTGNGHRPESFWQEIEASLCVSSRYFGADYGAVLWIQTEPQPRLRVLASARGGKVTRPKTEEVELPLGRIQTIMAAVEHLNDLEEFSDSVVRQALAGC
jgi:hypothetical protein